MNAQLSTLRRLARTVAATALAGTALLTAAAPAHAAGDTTRPDMYGCFTWGANVPYAGQPAKLQYWKASTREWVTTRTATTNSSGCIRFNDISPGYYYRLDGYRVWGYPLYYFYDGASGYVLSTSGDALYRMGTTYVSGPYYY